MRNRPEPMFEENKFYLTINQYNIFSLIKEHGPISVTGLVKLCDYRGQQIRIIIRSLLKKNRIEIYGHTRLSNGYYAKLYTLTTAKKNKEL